MKASFKKIPSQHEILLGTDFEGNRSVECLCKHIGLLPNYVSWVERWGWGEEKSHN